MKRQTILTKALTCFIFAMVLMIGGVLSSCDNKSASGGKDSDSVTYKESYDNAAVPSPGSFENTKDELSDLKDELLKKKTKQDLSDLQTEVSKKKAEDNFVN